MPPTREQRPQAQPPPAGHSRADFRPEHQGHHPHATGRSQPAVPLARTHLQPRPRHREAGPPQTSPPTKSTGQILHDLVTTSRAPPTTSNSQQAATPHKGTTKQEGGRHPTPTRRAAATGLPASTPPGWCRGAGAQPPEAQQGSPRRARGAPGRQEPPDHPPPQGAEPPQPEQSRRPDPRLQRGRAGEAPPPPSSARALPGEVIRRRRGGLEPGGWGGGGGGLGFPRAAPGDDAGVSHSNVSISVANLL